MSFNFNVEAKEIQHWGKRRRPLIDPLHHLVFNHCWAQLGRPQSMKAKYFWHYRAQRTPQCRAQRITLLGPHVNLLALLSENSMSPELTWRSHSTKKKKKTQLFSRTYRNEPHFIFSSCLSNLFTLPLVYWSLYFLSQARLALPTPVYMTCLLYPHLICFILFLSVFVFLYLTIPFPSMSFLTPQCFSWYWREGVIYKQCSGGPGPY